MSQAHLFALYTRQLPEASIEAGSTISFIDKDLRSRIIDILRLRTGEQIQLFNNTLNILLTLDESTAASKRGLISGTIIACKNNNPIQPTLDLFVGLTKREAFEEILYACAQMGATSITPLITQGMHRAWISEKDATRFAKIIISGCEQAKQFVLPIIKPLISLEKSIPAGQDYKFICLPSGMPLINCMKEVCEQNKSIALFVGPEAGFSPEEEIIILKKHIAKPIALGSSILRSQDAVRLMIGALRSISL